MKTQTPPVPELGTIGWLIFDPQAGREQAGRRPAIVLRHTRYNEKTGPVVFCPHNHRSRLCSQDQAEPHRHRRIPTIYPISLRVQRATPSGKTID